MRENGLIHKRRITHTITKATTEIQEKDNIIKRDFKADKSLTKLLTDITHVQCSDVKLYVSPVLDCHNGEIIALEMRETMKKELCIIRSNNSENLIIAYCIVTVEVSTQAQSSEKNLKN